MKLPERAAGRMEGGVGDGVGTDREAPGGDAAEPAHQLDPPPSIGRVLAPGHIVVRRGVAGDDPHRMAHFYQASRNFLAGFAPPGPNRGKFVINNQDTH